MRCTRILYIHYADEALVAACHGYHRLLVARGAITGQLDEHEPVEDNVEVADDGVLRERLSRDRRRRFPRFCESGDPELIDNRYRIGAHQLFLRREHAA